MSTTPTPAGLSDERIDAIGAQFYGTCFTPADRQFAREVAAAALSSQPPSAQEGVSDERGAFEAHFVSKFGTKPLTWREAEGAPYDVPDGMQENYYVRSTQQAWEAWQARAAILNSAAEIDEETERALFHADAEPMGFDLTRHVCAAPEPWSQYKEIDTGNRWGGWLARAALAGQAKSAAPVEAAAYRYKDTRGNWRYVGAPLTKGWAFPTNLAHEPLYATPPAAIPEAPAQTEASHVVTLRERSPIERTAYLQGVELGKRLANPAQQDTNPQPSEALPTSYAGSSFLSRPDNSARVSFEFSDAAKAEEWYDAIIERHDAARLPGDDDTKGKAS